MCKDHLKNHSRVCNPISLFVDLNFRVCLIDGICASMIGFVLILVSGGEDMWDVMGYLTVDELVDKDMSSKYGKWPFFEPLGIFVYLGLSLQFIGSLLKYQLMDLLRSAFLYIYCELSLTSGTSVGTSLIDAHASGMGVIESVPISDSSQKEDDKEDICHRMVLVCGTSTCHMAVSQNKVFIRGVWRPFWSAMLPEYWLIESWQSATGALLDYILNNHVAAPHLANRAASQSEFLPSLWSPMADPVSKGVICGLTLDSSEKQLALLYLATVQSIAYGTRQIVEHCNSHGHKVSCTITLPRESESVLLGAAILGSAAAKKYSGLRDATRALNSAGQRIVGHWISYSSSDR
ncbi:hypothetical protein GIB67_015803 [Kingdonia uniflora]|uniref:Carbohydrate kinase FGGY C-terminal domain-containing protein n=1 Tax=Kingdonia uniflora TaxID=39325 RepID=A0A7J7NUJ2_9MAGN|nr:hypothetical protein GIB67_015803 [Kingdonia uniflora]